MAPAQVGSQEEPATVLLKAEEVIEAVEAPLRRPSKRPPRPWSPEAKEPEAEETVEETGEP